MHGRRMFLDGHMHCPSRAVGCLHFGLEHLGLRQHQLVRWNLHDQSMVRLFMNGNWLWLTWSEMHDRLT